MGGIFKKDKVEKRDTNEDESGEKQKYKAKKIGPFQ